MQNDWTNPSHPLSPVNPLSPTCPWGIYHQDEPAQPVSYGPAEPMKASDMLIGGGIVVGFMLLVLGWVSLVNRRFDRDHESTLQRLKRERRLKR